MGFLPTSREEMLARGYEELDILLITGDFYVDHPSYGIAIVGHLLEAEGWRVGLVFQPDWKDPDSLRAMGRPRLGVGVTAGNMDSMVDLYTAGRRLRREDAYSENGIPGKRPPHAASVYAQLARQAFPKIPVVIGGLEASLRRVVHYDYWQDKLRPSILLDSKADILCYGMGEKPMPEIFHRIERGEPLTGIRGTAMLLGKAASEAFRASGEGVELPSYEEHLRDRQALMRATKIMEAEMNPFTGKRLLQAHGDRLLVVEPPPEPLTSAELDRVYALDYARAPHPSCKGRIPAFETVRDSISAVRGCPGGCAFCGLVAHQGRQVMSRSAESILSEIAAMTKKPWFRGTVSDIGGAAGNIYGSTNDREFCRRCRRSSCLFPAICPHYHCDGLAARDLLVAASKIPGVKHVYINSGIRLDLALRQPEYFRELVRNHVSGHMKVAPEHLHPEVLKLMRKNPAEEFYRIRERFEEESRACGKEQYLIPLFISNFPGCTAERMKVVDDYLNRNHWSLQQVQDYIPLPMTMGAAMYYCGTDPEGRPIPVNRGLAERRPQIRVLKKRRSGPDAENRNRPPRRDDRPRHGNGPRSGRR